jgi:hypothetical protein
MLKDAQIHDLGIGFIFFHMYEPLKECLGQSSIVKNLTSLPILHMHFSPLLVTRNFKFLRDILNNDKFESYSIAKEVTDSDHFSKGMFKD